MLSFRGSRTGNTEQGGVGNKPRADGTNVRGSSSSRDVAAEFYRHQDHSICSPWCSPGPSKARGKKGLVRAWRVINCFLSCSM